MFSLNIRNVCVNDHDKVFLKKEDDVVIYNSLSMEMLAN